MNWNLVEVVLLRFWQSFLCFKKENLVKVNISNLDSNFQWKYFKEKISLCFLFELWFQCTNLTNKSTFEVLEFMFTFKKDLIK